MQYTCSISYDVKAVRQWNLFTWWNIKWEKNFLEKSDTKCGGEASPFFFHKKNKIEHNAGSTFSNVIKFALMVYPPSRDLSKYIKTKVLTTCFYFT